MAEAMTEFDRIVADVAAELGMPVEQVVRVFDTYERIAAAYHREQLARWRERLVAFNNNNKQQRTASAQPASGQSRMSRLEGEHER